MGVDARITFEPVGYFAANDIADLNTGLNEWFDEHVRITPPPEAPKSHSIFGDDGDVYFKRYRVDVPWRYFDTYASRGPWPQIRALLDFLRRNLPEGSQIFYGHDHNPGMENDPEMTPERFEEIDVAFAKVRRRT